MQAEGIFSLHKVWYEWCIHVLKVSSLPVSIEKLDLSEKIDIAEETVIDNSISDSILGGKQPIDMERKETIPPPTTTIAITAAITTTTKIVNEIMIETERILGGDGNDNDDDNDDNDNDGDGEYKENKILNQDNTMVSSVKTVNDISNVNDDEVKSDDDEFRRDKLNDEKEKSRLNFEEMKKLVKALKSILEGFTTSKID